MIIKMKTNQQELTDFLNEYNKLSEYFIRIDPRNLRENI